MIVDSKAGFNQFQMRLTFNGNEYFPNQEILVDGEVINARFEINYYDLVGSISTDGELEILTCGLCAVSGCEHLHNGIYVSHSDSIVTWRVIDPKPVRVFRFGEGQYFASIIQFFHAATAIQESCDGSHDEYDSDSIGPVGFGSQQFAHCFRYLESLMDDEGNLVESHLRHTFFSNDDRSHEEIVALIEKSMAEIM